MAVKRALGNCAASTVGRVLSVDASHTAVSGWELKSAASLIAAARCDYIEFEMMFKDTARDRPAAAFHFVRTDATNKAVWHKKKIHSGRVESLYFYAAEKGYSRPELFGAVHASGDLLVVPPRCGAQAVYSLVRSHLRSVGAPLWDTSDAAPAPHAAPAPEQSGAAAYQACVTGRAVWQYSKV